MKRREWRVIPDFPNYEVSSDGKVRNRKTGRVLKTNVCNRLKSNKMQPHSSNVVLYKDHKVCSKQVHHLVYMSFIWPIIEKGECIHHKDGNPLNNRVENLKKLNSRLHVSLHKRGEKNYNAKLKETDIKEIKRCMKYDIYNGAQLSKIFNVSSTYIYDVKHNRSWKHIVV